MNKRISKETKEEIVNYIKFQFPYIVCLIGLLCQVLQMEPTLRISALVLCVLAMILPKGKRYK